jgi:hypothetical protein
LITKDSITVFVTDVRGAGGVTSVDLYAAIVAGPHAGKAPPPWTVGSSDFFVIAADSMRNASGHIVNEGWFIDIDDDYLRGGDVLHYFWLATDAAGGVSSNPTGLTRVPDSIEEAQLATRGMLEASFLPSIDWDPAYLARIAADPHGKLDPTSTELANSTQARCILYVNRINHRRRSGDLNRTTFMYTLDRLGYRGRYDVYDHSGMGNTNNHLGGRARVQQAEGYSLIVYDAGNAAPTGTIMPDGGEWDSQRIDQATWFRLWLAEAAGSEAGSATLWVIGSNALEEIPTNPLYAADMGAVLGSTAQCDLNLNPDVDGQTSFTFQRASLPACAVDFSSDRFSLKGGCPDIRGYDGLGAAGSAVLTHAYRDPWTGTLGDGAIVMNSNASESWNTILQSHAWADIRDPARSGSLASPPVQVVFLDQVLRCVLPAECQSGPVPTDAPDDEFASVSMPRVTGLHGNHPNPFNATTTIRFDLAREGHVDLRVYDVSGRRVRTLVNGVLERDRHTVVWGGRDDAGRHVSSGVYFCRLESMGFAASRRMVVLE